MTEQQSANAPAKGRSLLRRGLLVSAVAVAAVLVGGYYVLFMRYHATTDDAYVNGNLVRLTPQIAGTVIAINTDETQYVRRGQVLVELDPRDAQIALAEANLRAAWLASSRTRVLAPVSGYVVRRSVQLGDQVSPSTQMLALVPVTSMWVDANFKENQLGSLRIGQPVQVSVDMYGSHVQYHGTVLGLTAGTGSALAVLPTQNASGNWIKIVQRLPVRIGLQPAELARHPLFLGLSANIDVSVRDRGGSALSRVPAWPASQRTDVYTDQDSGADRMIDDVVSANLHGSGHALYARTAGRGLP